MLVAIGRAAAHYAPHEWFELPSRHRTRAIYSELQQLDAIASGRLQDVTDQSAPVRMRKSDQLRRRFGFAKASPRNLSAPEHPLPSPFDVPTLPIPQGG